MFADYKRMYRNVYPGVASQSPDQTSVNLSAYQNTTNCDNLFDQTDFTYKTATGPVFRTLDVRHRVRSPDGFVTEGHGLLSGRWRRPPLRSRSTRSKPTYFGPVSVFHTSRRTRPIMSRAMPTASTALDIASAYVQDQIEVTRWLQLIGGVRYDRFDLSALDQNTGITARACRRELFSARPLSS